jgi:hypothetical protein
MRQNLKDIVAVLAEVLPFPEPIVELGALQVESQIGFADLRPFFRGKRYIGCDMRPGPGVDRIENMHRLSCADASVGAVLCLDTLEHVANCHLAVEEMHRVLAPGGLLVLASVMDFEMHECPADYWRFTPKAIEMLMRRFETLQVYYQGNPHKPHTVLGIGRHSPEPLPVVLEERLRIMTPEPVMMVKPGLEPDAFADETRSAALARELAAARAEVTRATAELEAMQRSTTWRLATRLRNAPVLGQLLRAMLPLFRKNTAVNS